MWVEREKEEVRSEESDISYQGALSSPGQV